MVLSPRERFADQLAQLRVATRKSAKALVRYNRTAAPAMLRGLLSEASLSTLLNGKFVEPPRWEVVEAFVDACRALSHDAHGRHWPEVKPQLDIDLWRHRHSALMEAPRRERPAAGPVPPDRYVDTRFAFDTYHSVVLDRDVELRQLLTELRGPGAYHVIEAPAFAGKTAFLVELYRRLSARGSPTAIFYVVDRYSNRSQDFLDAIIGQLLAFLRHAEPIAAGSERPDQFARLWTAFAALGTSDQPAILLVDGLDEQLPADGIGQLLPVRLSGHAHVVVATRNLPDFRAGVPRHHALAASSTSVLELTTSPHAAAKSDDAKRHLEKWLSSTEPNRERIATLFFVARAPLSLHDLAELLDLSVGQVAQHLRDIERCLLPIGKIGYQWAHARYGEFVRDWVGKARCAQAIQAIVAWSDGYARAGWPETTPPFLLHGLHHFLRAHGGAVGTARLVNLVTSARRHRLLATYGHEGMLVETIVFARQELDEAGVDSAHDLENVFRLDLHELSAVSPTILMPSGLLRLLVLAGHPDQAEGLARYFEESNRAQACAEISQALTEVGSLKRARELVDQAWGFTMAQPDDYWRLVAMRACARAATKAGTVIPSLVPEPYLDSDDQRVLCGTAGFLLDAGDLDSTRIVADRLMKRAERADGIYPWVWADIAAVLSELGELDRSIMAARRAIAGNAPLGAQLLGFNGGAEIGQVVQRLVRALRVDEAVDIATSIEGSDGDYLRACVCAALVEVLIKTGQHQPADELLERELGLADAMTHPEMRLVALAHLRAAQAHGGNVDPTALHELVEIASSIEYASSQRGLGLVKLGEGFLAAGNREVAARVAQRALALNGSVSNPFNDRTMHDLAIALIEVGDISGARGVAEANPNHAWRAPSIRAVEVAEATTGELLPLGHYAGWPLMDRARLAVRLADRDTTQPVARELASDIIARGGRADALRDRDWTAWPAALRAIEALYRASGVEQCEVLLANIRKVDRRAEAFATLSRCCHANDGATAERLLDKAVDLAIRVRALGKRLSTLCTVLRAAGPRRELSPRVFEAARREIVKRLSVDTDDDRYSRCEALARLGLNEEALSAAEELDYFALALVVEGHVDRGDLSAAGQVAQRAFEAWPLSGFADAELVEGVVRTMLSAGRVDLAKLALRDYSGFEEQRLAYTLVKGMVTHGHALEALALARGFKLHSGRAAALTGWASAPTWPLDMRRRNLRLLVEHALR